MAGLKLFRYSRKTPKAKIGLYSQALESTDYEYGTLKKFKWVSSKVALCLRRHNLSYKHHEEVASLKPDEQKKWLDKAEQHNLTTL